MAKNPCTAAETTIVTLQAKCRGIIESHHNNLGVFKSQVAQLPKDIEAAITRLGTVPPTPANKNARQMITALTQASKDLRNRISGLVNSYADNRQVLELHMLELELSRAATQIDALAKRPLRWAPAGPAPRWYQRAGRIAGSLVTGGYRLGSAAVGSVVPLGVSGALEGLRRIVGGTMSRDVRTLEVVTERINGNYLSIKERTDAIREQLAAIEALITQAAHYEAP